MDNPYIVTAIYISEFLIFYIFYSRIGYRKYNKTITISAGLLLFEAGAVLNLLFHNNVFVNTFAFLIIKFIFSYVFFGLRLIPAIVYSIITDVLTFALEMVSILIITTIAGQPPANFATDYTILPHTLICSKMMLFMTCLGLSNLVNRKGNGSKIPFSLFLYPSSAIVCLFTFEWIAMRVELPEMVKYLLVGVNGLIFLATVLLFITYQHQIEEKMELVRLKSEFARLQTEKSYYDILEQQNHNLMVYAHDAKKHLAAIQSLSHDPEIDGYLKALSDQLKSYSKNCHSGNKMLDIMIHKYELDCSAKNLDFYYDVKQCNLNHIEDIDLVAILGNLMDNAVTAAMDSEEKQLSLETTVRNGYSVLVIVNTCDKPPQAHGDQLVTTKQNKEIHGLGLRSVSKTLAKYQGDFQWEYDEVRHLFTMTVMIGDKIK